MAKEGEEYKDEDFKGIKKYFNTYTLRGRANSAKAVYAVLIPTIIYFAFIRKKKEDKK